MTHICRRTLSEIYCTCSCLIHCSFFCQGSQNKMNFLMACEMYFFQIHFSYNIITLHTDLRGQAWGTWCMIAGVALKTSHRTSYNKSTRVPRLYICYDLYDSKTSWSIWKKMTKIKVKSRGLKILLFFYSFWFIEARYY